MYVAREDWSNEEAGDPPPCFRQGDLVRLTWVRPEVQLLEGGTVVKITGFEVRTEAVALLGACCDLVIRSPAKRKGVTISPLREIPKQIAKKPALLEALKATVAESLEKKLEIFPNLVYFAASTDNAEGVVHLESASLVDYSLLKAATKLAELTDAARADFRERIKNHYTRELEQAPETETAPPEG